MRVCTLHIYPPELWVAWSYTTVAQQLQVWHKALAHWGCGLGTVLLFNAKNANMERVGNERQKLCIRKNAREHTKLRKECTVRIERLRTRDLRKGWTYFHYLGLHNSSLKFVNLCYHTWTSKYCEVLLDGNTNCQELNVLRNDLQPFVILRTCITLLHRSTILRAMQDSIVRLDINVCCTNVLQDVGHLWYVRSPMQTRTQGEQDRKKNSVCVFIHFSLGFICLPSCSITIFENENWNHNYLTEILL